MAYYFAVGTPSNIHGTAISYRCAKFGAFVNSVTILTLRDLTIRPISVVAVTCDQCSGDILCLSYGGMGGGVVGWKCRLSVQGTTVFSLHNDSLLHPTTREPRRAF